MNRKTHQFVVSMPAKKGVPAYIAARALRDAMRGHGDFFGTQFGVKALTPADPQALREVLTWTLVSTQLPDADMTVHIDLGRDDGEQTWLGYYDGQTWHEVDGLELTSVFAWAPMLGGAKALLARKGSQA